jgi:hypothetical protein
MRCLITEGRSSITREQFVIYAKKSVKQRVLRKSMPFYLVPYLILDLIPGRIPVLRTAYVQIEFSALFEQIRAKPPEHSRGHDVVGEYAVYMMARPPECPQKRPFRRPCRRRKP